MAKHSRNNTASSVFSYAEYKKLDHYGTKKQRLGLDSMRRFDACSLCLQRAREPMACQKGHLYCKECIYSDLLAQKKDIKRHQAKLEQMAREEEEEREKAREAARERVLRDFERSQLGLASSSLHYKKELNEVAGTPSDAPIRGTKRKFDFDQEKVDLLAKEAEEAALKQIEAEQAESRKAKLPDFWLPSLTPQALPGPLKDIKLHTLCNASSPSHLVSLKNLVPVNFTLVGSSGPANSTASTPSVNGSAIDSSKSNAAKEEIAICPSCKRTLSNSIVTFVLQSCSHVICKTCCETLVQPSKQCCVCDKPVKEKEIVELQREGTGFSAGGRAETSKAGVSFQG